LTEHPLITPALSGTVRDHSHLREPRLLDAAHILMDADEQVGQPVISNGLPLTKIHDAAFDAHLIGGDPDFRVHTSDRLLDVIWAH
jgi:putative restriction endonuclease